MTRILPVPGVRGLLVFEALAEAVQDGLAKLVVALEERGPQLARPNADRLYGSDYANMKELRFDADGGVWWVAFAFDPERKGILLVAGNKAGKKEKKFYKTLIKRADERFAEHLRSLKR